MCWCSLSKLNFISVLEISFPSIWNYKVYSVWSFSEFGNIFRRIFLSYLLSTLRVLHKLTDKFELINFVALEVVEPKNVPSWFANWQAVLSIYTVIRLTWHKLELVGDSLVWIYPIPVISAFSDQSNSANMSPRFEQAGVVMTQLKKVLFLSFRFEWHNIHPVSSTNRSSVRPKRFEISRNVIRFCRDFADL